MKQRKKNEKKKKKKKVSIAKSTLILIKVLVIVAIFGDVDNDDQLCMNFTLRLIVLNKFMWEKFKISTKCIIVKISLM